MTRPTLLDEFIIGECTPYVRKLLCDALACRVDPGVARRMRFELNRFEVTLSFEDKTALLEDVLDTSPAGSRLLRFDELLARLACDPLGG